MAKYTPASTSRILPIMINGARHRGGGAEPLRPAASSVTAAATDGSDGSRHGAGMVVDGRASAYHRRTRSLACYRAGPLARVTDAESAAPEVPTQVIVTFSPRAVPGQCRGQSGRVRDRCSVDGRDGVTRGDACFGGRSTRDHATDQRNPAWIAASTGSRCWTSNSPARRGRPAAR